MTNTPTPAEALRIISKTTAATPRTSDHARLHAALDTLDAVRITARDALSAAQAQEAVMEEMAVMLRSHHTVQREIRGEPYIVSEAHKRTEAALASYEALKKG